MKHSINYYGIYNQDGTRATDKNGKRLYSKEGQWLTEERAEQLRAMGYIVKIMPGYNF